jgi:hypothetical protein
MAQQAVTDATQAQATPATDEPEPFGALLYHFGTPGGCRS